MRNLHLYAAAAALALFVSNGAIAQDATAPTRGLAPGADAPASSGTVPDPEDEALDALDPVAALCLRSERSKALAFVKERLAEMITRLAAGDTVSIDEVAILETQLAIVDRTIPASYLWRDALDGMVIPAGAPSLAARVAWLRGDITELSPLTAWEFVGPFDNERGRGMTRPVPAEKAPAEAEYAGKVRAVSWREVPAPGPRGLILLGELADPADQAAFVSRTWVRSEGERTAVLLVTASEELRAWCNGVPVYEALGLHARGADGHSLSIDLAAGWNEISLKVGGQDRTPSFAARLVDPKTAAPIALDSRSRAPEDAAPHELANPGRKLKKSRVVPSPGARAYFVDSARKEPGAAGHQVALSFLERAAQEAPRKERPGYWRAFAAHGTAPDSPATTFAMLDTMRVAGAIDTEEDVNPWLDLLKDAIEREGPLPQLSAWYAGFADRSQGLTNRALEITDACLAAYPDSIVAQLRQIEYLQEIGQRDLARLAAEKLATDPNLSAWPNQAMGLSSYFSPSEPQHQRLVTMAAERGHPGAQRRVTRREELAAGAMDPDRFLEHLRTKLDRSPYASDERLWGARRLLASGHAEPALALVDEALTYRPESSKLHAWRGRVLLAMGDTASATESLELAVEYDFSSADEERLLEYLRSTNDTAEEENAFYAAFEEELADIAARHPAKEGSTGAIADAPREVLLNRRVVEVSPDGTARRYRRIVERVLSDAGVRELDRRVFRAYRGAEDQRVLAVRVLHEDGTVDEGRTARGTNLNIDLPPLRVGDIVDLEWRRDDLRPSIFGTYFGLDAAFVADPRLATAESEIVIMASPGVELFFHVTGTEAASVTIDTSEERTPDGTIVHTWSTGNLAPRRAERLEPPSQERTPRVQASTYSDWEGFGTWWWSLIREEIAVSPEMREKVIELTSGKETPLEKLRAVYDFVVTDIRYNAWEFGVHGYQPYSAPVIFSRRFGDCKDKAILLRAMLQETGIEAWPVLVRSDGRRFEEDHELPLVEHFNHCIAHIPAQDGIPEMFLDGTARLHPLEVLPTADQGAKVLTVRDDSVEQMRIPFPKAEDNDRRETLLVDLSEAAKPRVTLIAEPTGRYDTELRYTFAADDAVRDETAEQWLTQRFGALSGAIEAEHPDYEDLTGPVRLVLTSSAETVGRKTDDGLELPTTFQPFRLTQGIASESERTTDVLLDVPWSSTQTLVYTLPKGAKVLRRPEPLEIRGADLTFQRSVEVSGDGDSTPLTITVRERFELGTHRVPVERYNTFRNAARQIDAAQRATIEIEVQP